MTNYFISYQSSDGNFTLNETEHGFSAYLNGKNVSVGIKKETVFRVAKKTEMKYILDEIQSGGGENVAFRIRKRLEEEELKFVNEDGMEFLESFNEGIELQEKLEILIPNIGLGRDHLNFDENEKILDKAFYQCYSNGKDSELEEDEKEGIISRESYIAFSNYTASEEYLFKYLYNYLVNKIDLDIGQEFNQENIEKFLRTGEKIVFSVGKFEEKLIGEINYYNSLEHKLQTLKFNRQGAEGMSFSEMDGYRRLGDRFRERITKLYNHKFMNDLYISIKMIYEDVLNYENSMKVVLTDSGKSSIQSGTMINFEKMGEMIRTFSKLIIQNYEYTQHLTIKYLNGNNDWEKITVMRKDFLDKRISSDVKTFITKRHLEEMKNKGGKGNKVSFLKSLFVDNGLSDSLRNTELDITDNNMYLSSIEGNSIKEKIESLRFMFQIGIFNRYMKVEDLTNENNTYGTTKFNELIYNGNIELGESFILTGNNSRDQLLFTFQIKENKISEVPSFFKSSIFGRKTDVSFLQRYFNRFVERGKGNRESMLYIECIDHIMNEVQYIPLYLKETELSRLIYSGKNKEDLEGIERVFSNRVFKELRNYIDSKLGRGSFNVIGFNSKIVPLNY